MNARQRAQFPQDLEALKAELSEEIDRTVHTMQTRRRVRRPERPRQPGVDMALELRNRDREGADQKIDETIARIDAKRIRLLRELAGSRSVSSALEGAPPRPVLDCKTRDELKGTGR